jgi:hypothetical protein
VSDERAGNVRLDVARDREGNHYPGPIIDMRPVPIQPPPAPTTVRPEVLTRIRDSLTVQSLLMVVTTRLLLFGLVWFTLRAIPRLPLYPDHLADNFLPGALWLDGWARWDTAHYVTVARHGYGGEGIESPGGGLGFFPLFPYLMRWAVQLSGVGITDARLAATAVAIANVCFLAAVPLFAHLTAKRHGDEVARTATLLLCLSPFSLFFSAGYSESLFLLLVLLAFAAADRGWWLAAAICSALVTATRLVGLALPPALLLLAWRRGARPRDLVLTALISPLGAVGYALYTWRAFDDPFAYFTAQANWGGWEEHVGYYAELFWTMPREALLGDVRHLVIVLNVALGLLWLASLPFVWRRLDPGIALFTTLMVVGHAAMTWVSLGRYLLVAIGFYPVIALLLTRPDWRGWPRDLVLVGSALLLTTLAILFSHGFWVV